MGGEHIALIIIQDKSRHDARHFPVIGCVDCSDILRLVKMKNVNFARQDAECFTVQNNWKRLLMQKNNL